MNESYWNRQYNLTLERYNAILESQNGACAICCRVPAKFVVDHDHMCCPGQRSCGFCVRGLLCNSCNVGIGLFRDDHRTLARAKKYIFNFRKSRGIIKTNSRHKEEIEMQGPFGKTPAEPWDLS